VTSYLAVFLAAAATTFVVTPLVRRLVVAAGAIDQPSDRKVHPNPTPTLGGIAMFMGFIAGLAASRFLPFFAEVNAASPEPLAIVVTCALMVGLGIIDDTRGVSALAKAAAQIFIAGVLVLLGVQLAYFPMPGGPQGIQVVVLSVDLAVVLTILWVVVVANAVNLVDGLDGLAAGIVAIAAVVFFVYMVRSPSLFDDASQAASLSAITAGICVGFLPWNFHPAKIFMGDTGAMLLGMLLATATISGVGRTPVPPTPGDLAVVFTAVLSPLLVLFVPFLDVVLAVIRRTRRGESIGHADKEHLHHRLMDIGHGHRQAVLLMYLWSALLAASGLAIGLIDGRAAVGIVLLVALVLFVVTAGPRVTERRRNGVSPQASGEPGSGGTDGEHTLRRTGTKPPR